MLQVHTHADTPSCTARTHKLIPHLQGVFTYLIESLGTKNVQFEELISLDPESLQQLNPIGVIFLFKYPTGEKPQKDKPLDGEFDFAAVEAQGEENVWFAAQTIQNACGTQALLSVLLNKDGSSEDGNVDIGPNLREFKEFTSGFPADVRQETLIPASKLHHLLTTLCSSAVKHCPTQTSSATPTTRLPAAHLL